MVGLPSEKAKQFEQDKAARRVTPSGLSTPEEGRQRQNDMPPASDYIEEKTLRHDSVYGDKGIGKGFRY